MGDDDRMAVWPFPPPRVRQFVPKISAVRKGTASLAFTANIIARFTLRAHGHR